MQTSPLPLKITITVHRTDERIVIEVTNTGSLSAGDSALEPAGAGVGLRNIRERLETLYPHRHELQLTEAEGRVKVVVSYPDSRSP
jgi:LytS/YehU family sensor histidine kinase